MVVLSHCSVDLEHGGSFLRVFFQIYNFEPGALLVWMGTRSAGFTNLSCTLPLALPSTTALLSDNSASTERSDNLVRHLVTKLSRPVYLSYNLPSSTPLPLLVRAENALFEILEKTLSPSSSEATTPSNSELIQPTA